MTWIRDVTVKYIKLLHSLVMFIKCTFFESSTNMNISSRCENIMRNDTNSVFAFYKFHINKKNVLYTHIYKDTFLQVSCKDDTSNEKMCNRFPWHILRFFIPTSSVCKKSTAMPFNAREKKMIFKSVVYPRHSQYNTTSYWSIQREKPFYINQTKFTFMARVSFPKWK